MMKIGVFGGTFNPPHLGHLIVIEHVQDQLRFDKILFIPSANPPHKKETTLVSAQMRFEMTQLAVRNNPAFEVSDIEIRLGGISYSVQTINALKNLYPKAKLFFIIGADNFLELETWKSTELLLSEVELIVMHRPSFDISSTKSKYSKYAHFIKVPSIEISSTDIRRRVKLKKSIRYLVPPLVEKYIFDHHLYQ